MTSSPLLFFFRERSMAGRRRLFPFRMADQSKSTVSMVMAKIKVLNSNFSAEGPIS